MAPSPKTLSIKKAFSHWWSFFPPDSPQGKSRSVLIYISAFFYTAMFAIVFYEIQHQSFLPQWAAAIHLGTMIFGNTFHCAATIGPKETFKFFCWSTFITFVMEAYGTNFGWPFGRYKYAQEMLGPIIPHTGVPIMVPISYFMLAYPCFILVNIIYHGKPLIPIKSYTNLFSSAFTAAFINTTFDTAVDPNTTFHKYYYWEDIPHPCDPNCPALNTYFCVPITNYFGWLVTTSLVFLPWNSHLKINPTEEFYYTHQMTWAAQILGFSPFIAYFLLNTMSNLNPALSLISFFTMGIPMFIAVCSWSMERNPHKHKSH